LVLALAFAAVQFIRNFHDHAHRRGSRLGRNTSAWLSSNRERSRMRGALGDDHV